MKRSVVAQFDMIAPFAIQRVRLFTDMITSQPDEVPGAASARWSALRPSRSDEVPSARRLVARAMPSNPVVPLLNASAFGRRIVRSSYVLLMMSIGGCALSSAYLTTPTCDGLEMMH